MAANHEEDLPVDVENPEVIKRLPPIDAQKEEWDKVKRIKDQLREGEHNPKLKILEKMVPNWYHRNDNNAEENSRLEDHSSNEIISNNDDEEEPKQIEQNQQRQEIVEENQQEEIMHGIKQKPDNAQQTYHSEEPQKVNHYQPREEKNQIIQELIENDTTIEEDEGNKQLNTTINEEAPNRSKSDLKGNLRITNDVETPQFIIKQDGSRQRTLQSMDIPLNKSQCPNVMSSINTTLVVQCSLDRIWILHETCRRWHDPIVTVVHITEDNETTSTLEERQNYWKGVCPQMLIMFHLPGNTSKDWDYPVNRLRNIGLDAVRTSHVLVIDVDFVPSLDLDLSIKLVLAERRVQYRYNDQLPSSISIPDENVDAIVIPAFEKVQHDDCTKTECRKILLEHGSTFIPENKNSLKNCVSSNNCTVFQLKNNWEGHWSTHSDEWVRGQAYENKTLTINEKSNATSRIIRRIQCFDSLRYEPYVVIQWCPDSGSSDGIAKPSAPYYDERFSGYGKNKIQLISHLRFLGYQFSVLPDGFLVHHPHPESKAKNVWNNVDEYDMHKDMDSLYKQYLQELMKKYKASLEESGTAFVAACNKR
eukprot:CAMPEP_0194239626 /NCGR_PEP_ID=MMETSP0158-20130606/6029_1 /TAXON_ID=33649 /ORGANISM="Thalassionema nitzschioides, Strain L26-B" /LENGTH=589 /DNA_ID=CAMNT_0038974137 /DNA_START=386 /DNA_END=2155 /DNA_ORIENTATION=+